MLRAHPIGLLAALLVLLPAVALGDEDEGFSRSGLYIGVGRSYVTDTFESELSDAVGVPIDVEDSHGYNARIGYRLLPFLAAELEYEYIEEFDIKTSVSVPPFPGGKFAEIEAQSFTANLKWILPTWRFQPYVLTGVGGAHFKINSKNVPSPFSFSDSTTDFAGRLGAGFDIYITKHIVMNAGANAVLTTIDANILGTNVDHIFYVGGQMGMQYRF